MTNIEREFSSRFSLKPGALLICLLLLSSRAQGRDRLSAKTPARDTAISSSATPEENKNGLDLTVRAGNESNGADGIFGPFTYGLIGQYTASSGMELEATFIRMHEPGQRTFDSFLDEGQLTLRLPPFGPTTLAATLWKNRMMDMYTTVGGIEVGQSSGDYTIEGGLYLGTASREEVAGRFLGGRLSVSVEFGDLEVALEHMAGMIHLPGDPSTFGVGQYHKSSLEAALNLSESLHVPLRTTLGIERRYFNFGSSGPVSEAIDTYIVVVGIEVSVSEL